jgi:tripartite-type tricarboxylate transporter receptor subunit TctC
LAAGEFGRPLVTPPGFPADRLKIMRDAFDKAVSDPALLAAAEKRRLEMDPTSGVEMEALAKEVIAATPEVVQRVEKLLGGKN